MIVYTLCEVLLLIKLGLWDFSQIKNTLVWFFSVGFLSLFQMNAIKSDGKYFKRIVFDNLKLIAIIQFIIDFYTFSLTAELIIVPSLAFIGILAVVAEQKSEHLKVKNFLEGVLSFFGLIFFVYVIFKITSSPYEFLNRGTGLDFLIPILLTVLFIPFLFFLLVFSSYERFFLVIDSYIKSKRKRFFAKIIAIIVFNVRINLFQRWLNTLYKEDTKTYKGLVLSFKKIFRMRRVERNPKFVNPKNGWIPYEIKEVLSSHGIITGFYKESSNIEWYSCSNYLEIGEGILTSKIAYYVTGSETIANKLELVLNVNRLEDLDEAHQTFCKLGKILFWYAVNRKSPDWLETALLNSTQLEKTITHHKIIIKKNDYHNKKIEGYTLSLEISIWN
jgi:hypothetical protein